MAATIITFASNTPRGTKIARMAIDNTAESTITIVDPYVSGNRIIEITASAASLFHSTSGQCATDGYPLAANVPFRLPVESNVTYYVRGAAGAANIDMIVLQ
jgi:hypothetical protein